MQNTTFWLRTIADDARAAGTRLAISQSRCNLECGNAHSQQLDEDEWVPRYQESGRADAAPRLFETELKIVRYFIATALGGDAIPPSTLSGHETNMKSYWRS